MRLLLLLKMNRLKRTDFALYVALLLNMSFYFGLFVDSIQFDRHRHKPGARQNPLPPAWVRLRVGGTEPLDIVDVPLVVHFLSQTPWRHSPGNFVRWEGIVRRRHCGDFESVGVATKNAGRIGWVESRQQQVPLLYYLTVDLNRLIPAEEQCVVQSVLVEEKYWEAPAANFAAADIAARAPVPFAEFVGATFSD